MSKNTYRFIILLLTGLLIFVIWWGVSFSRNNSEIVELPQVIEDIYPLPNDQVPQQSSIIVDVPVGYEIALIVDNYIIPAQEILFQDAIGLATWRPGPNKSFESWTAGKHTVVVQWSKTTGLPDVGEFSWIFYTY